MQNEVKLSCESTGIVKEVQRPNITKSNHDHSEAELKSNALFQNWNETTKNIMESECTADINDFNLENVDTLTMWLWDVWEDSYKKPGHVFLFGKAEINGVLTSTCVQITNVEHCLYLLPRKKVI